MPIGDPKYTAAQRDAIELHYVDKDRTAREVAAAAAAGELRTRAGETLDAFTVPPNTVRDIGRKVRKRRAGRIASPLADKAPRDAVENLRRRLVNLADRELADLERQRAGTVDPERLRQVTRVVLEIARIPGPTDPRPASAATRDAEGRKGPETKGGLAGPLLAAHRAGTLAPVQTGGTLAAPERQHHRTDNGDNGARSAATPQSTPVQTGEETDGPGVWARRQAEVLGGGEQG